MKGLREFVIGFSVSLASVSLGGQLYAFDASTKKTHKYSPPTQIDLFKKQAHSQRNTATASLFADIKHHSLIKETTADTSIGQIPQSFSYAINTPNDDEILSINIDGAIPIEYSTATTSSQQAEILHFEDDDISAMLPTSVDEETDFTTDSPWQVVKGSKHTKNKQLLQELESEDIANSLKESFDITLEENKDDSYRVAEKIKSSLLFPIPNEILNDENLTPTFIKKKSSSKDTIPEKDNKPKEEKASKKELTIIQQQTPKQAEEPTTSKSFLGNISSWFSSTEEKNTQPKTKKAPSYSSQEASQQIPEASSSDNNEFINFYKTLQETSIAHKNNSIIPSELKLSFQPERAEISGQTLRWLKAFSEAAQNDDTYLQVRLDVSASTELQRKRLNLLYTIFMNNGVDFQKIDTVFSLNEPNAFIIRTMKAR